MHSESRYDQKRKGIFFPIRAKNSPVMAVWTICIIVLPPPLKHTEIKIVGITQPPDWIASLAELGIIPTSY